MKQINPLIHYFQGSIMIGTALSHKEQMNILDKLDKTDIPWNCAHGRVS